MARWLGVDASGAAVRVALLSSGYRRTSLLALREERFADHETPSDALRAAVTALRADACAVNLPGYKGFLRRIDLPRAAQRELLSVLTFEVESTLPCELDDAVMDHKRLRSIAGVDGDEVLPLLVAVASAGDVRERIGFVKRALGIEPARVGVGSLALANLAMVSQQIGAAEPTAIISLDEDTCELTILRGGEPRFFRCLNRGIVGLPAEAGALKIELRQSFAAWRAQGGAPIERAIVVGPGRRTPGVEGWLQAELGVALVDLPRLSIEMTNEQDEQLPRYAKAIALALSLSRRAGDLNLRQGALEAQQSFQFLREKTPILAGLSAAILVSAGFAVFAETRALDAERTSLEAQLWSASKAQLSKATRDPKEAADMLDAAVSGKTDDPLPAMDAFDVLVAMSDRIPKDMTHDILDFDLKKNNLAVKGLVDSIENAKTLETAMGEQPCFKDVALSHTTKMKEKDKDKQKYTLELKIDCTKSKPDKKPAAAPKGSGG